jgi:hypothetical protein
LENIWLLGQNEAWHHPDLYEEPNFLELPDFSFDWSKSVYGELHEQIPQDAPELLGKFVTLSHYVDANLMHDMVTGHSVTGILHLVNKTPIDWFSKKQATVETATYGSEFVAACTCVKQVIELQHTLVPWCPSMQQELHVW